MSGAAMIGADPKAMFAAYADRLAGALKGLGRRQAYSAATLTAGLLGCVVQLA